MQKTQNHEIPKILADAIGRHRSEVFRFLMLSVRDAEVAKKLTRDCLSVAYRDWFNHREYTRTSTWLMSIAVRVQKRYRHKKRLLFWRKQDHAFAIPIDQKDWIPYDRCPPELHAFALEQVMRVWKAVYAMSDDERTIFLLHFVENFNKSDISQATGLENRTINEYLSLALRRVHIELHNHQRGLRMADLT